MNSHTQIISAPWIIPVIPRNTVLKDHALVIENDQIAAILERDEALKNYPDAEHIQCNTHALLPGFVNSHTHAAMNLFRGLADDLPLMEWLNDHIWPAEAKWVNETFVHDGTEVAIAEMLLSGTTCFSDMYFYPDVVAKKAQDMGIRAFVGMILMDFPTAWASNSDEYFSKGLAVHDETRSLSLVKTTLAPHAPYTVSDAPLKRVQTYADELYIPIHMHVHETQHEVEDAKTQQGQRPLSRLNELGLLNPRMVAVHMTQLEDEEVELAAQQGIHIVHCPESNLKLASGHCRVHDLLEAGANVCLGTDSASSNNDLDMLGEMRTASLLAKTTSNNAKAVPAWQALEMATINGAKALNAQQQIGSLEVGKAADIIAIDLNNIATQPVYDPISTIVYSATREQVSDVWVAGKPRVRNRQLVDINLEQILSKASDWAERINSAD